MTEPVAIIGQMSLRAETAPPAVCFYLEEGVVQKGEFAGWVYRIQTDRRGVRWTLSDGSVLVLCWPDESEVAYRPLPCRWLYLPVSMLQEG